MGFFMKPYELASIGAGALVAIQKMSKKVGTDDKEITSTHGKVAHSGADGISTSKYTYKPNRKRYRESRFDAVNCPHGIFAYHETGTIKQDFCDRLKFQDIYYGHLAKGTLDIWTGNIQSGQVYKDDEAGMFDAGLNKRMIAIDWVETTYTFVNENNVGCWFTLYDIGPKTIVSVPNSPSDCRNNYYIDEGKRGTAWNNVGIPATNYDLNVKITDLVMFNESWKIYNMTKFWLRPGEVHVHKTFRRTNFQYDPRWWDRNVNSSFAMHPQLEHFCYAEVEGKLGYKNDTDDVMQMGVNIAYQVKRRIHLHARQYLEKKFEVNYNAWDGVSVNQNIVNTIEEIPHDQVTGKN